MSQNDYIILCDENGTPYIAHAGWLDSAKNAVNKAASNISTAAQQVANKAKGVGRGVRQNHKYILKVFENGRTRYFYKQEEVKAYYEAKKRGIKNAAEYAQNAVKDKASDVADAAKNAVNKATGAIANKTAETAKKNADDASRWAKMTERVHKENVANFKQNPTKANLARAKQSGQAVTRANQNEKNAHKEADKAQAIADQHPANKAKSAFDQAKASASNSVTNAKNNYERMKSEFRDKAQQTADNLNNQTKDLRTAASRKASDTAQSLKEKASDVAEKVTGANAKKELERSKQATRNAINSAESYAMKNGKRSNELDADVKSAKRSEDFNQFMYEKSLAGKATKAASTAKSSAQEMINKAKAALKDTANKASDAAKETKSNAQSVIDATKVAKQRETVQMATEEFNQAREKARAAKSKYDETHAPEDKQAYESADKQAKDASTKMTEAAQELTRLENSGSKGTLATYNAAKTERKRREVLGEFEQALDKENQLINKVKSFENGLKDKYGENWYNDATEAERNNLLSLRKQRSDAYHETQKDKYWEAYYDYYDSPLARIERAKKNKKKQS